MVEILAACGGTMVGLFLGTLILGFIDNRKAKRRSRDKGSS